MFNISKQSFLFSYSGIFHSLIIAVPQKSILNTVSSSTHFHGLYSMLTIPKSLSPAHTSTIAPVMPYASNCYRSPATIL